MRLVRAFVYASVALMLAAGWAFLYWRLGTIDLAAGNTARAALQDLRALDARWDRQLGDSAAIENSGALAQAGQHGSALAWLELHALRLAHPDLGRALGGVRSAFDQKGALLRRIAAGEPRFEEAWRVPTRERIAELDRALEIAFAEALAEAERNRQWLLYYSAFLLLLVAALAFELRRANANLERRVVERTRELSTTLDKLKESETMLVQSEKMSSLGQMVAGVAHEVNTPLAYVKAGLEAVQARVGEAGRLAREARSLIALLEADGIDEAALSAQFATVRRMLEDKRFETLDAQLKDGLHGIGQIVELVSDLKDFSRLERGTLAQYDVREGIETTLRIAQPELGKRTVKKIFGELPTLTCSPSQINQVMLNLIVNAAQATPEAGGTIVVRTSLRDKEHVAIDVMDNGPGIPAELLPKIFDPFFTTKEVGKGTGLGLSISYRIVESHGGKLEVQSKPGAGTRFTVVLPVRAPAALAA